MSTCLEAVEEIKARVDGLERLPGRSRSCEPPTKAARVSFADERSSSAPPSLRSLPSYIYDSVLVISNMSTDDEKNATFVTDFVEKQGLAGGKCTPVGKYKGLTQIVLILVMMHDDLMRPGERSDQRCQNWTPFSTLATKSRRNEPKMNICIACWEDGYRRRAFSSISTNPHCHTSHERQLLARIQEASLVEGPSWPSSWKPSEFAAFVCPRLREEEG